VEQKIRPNEILPDLLILYKAKHYIMARQDKKPAHYAHEREFTRIMCGSLLFRTPNHPERNPRRFDARPDRPKYAVHQFCVPAAQ
jgi:hypothetical protein